MVTVWFKTGLLLSTCSAWYTSQGFSKPTRLNSATFEDLPLHPKVQVAIRSQATWELPTPIQELAVPQLLENDAVWCEAPTGAGKTLAFVLPLLHNLLRPPTSRRPRALILSPTRELALQIGRVTKNLVSNISKSKLKVLVVCGGVPREEQIAGLAAAPDIVIATPGRLLDVMMMYETDETEAVNAALGHRLMEALEERPDLSLAKIQELKLDRPDDQGRGALPQMLQDIEYLILDEADRLLGRQFESEVREVTKLLPSRVPTWLFSATFPKALEPSIHSLFHTTTGQTPIRISCTNLDRVVDQEVSGRLAKKLEGLDDTKAISKIGPASTIDFRTIRLEKRDRTQALRFLIAQSQSQFLVFVATRYSSEHVAQKLRRYGIRCAELHGKLDQNARIRRLEDLRRGKIRVLIATDIASRGLDISNLGTVVNYDLPRSTADFIHRVGRTGRAGKAGTAITFCTAATESHLNLIEKRHLTVAPEREVLPGFAVDEAQWAIEAEAFNLVVPGSSESSKGLAHDRMFGGIKGRRKSKKDRLREQAAAKETQEL